MKKIVARKKGDFNAPWLELVYRKVKWGYQILFPDGTKSLPNVPCGYRTLRKTTTRNLHKWKYRKKVLNESLKTRELTLWTNFWWAKFWRKSTTLRKLAEQLKNTPDLGNYDISNEERSRRIVDALNQAEEYYRKFDFLFMEVDPMLGYQCDSFGDFLKKNKKVKKEKFYRPLPFNYVKYF